MVLLGAERVAAVGQGHEGHVASGGTAAGKRRAGRDITTQDKEPGVCVCVRVCVCVCMHVCECG